MEKTVKTSRLWYEYFNFFQNRVYPQTGLEGAFPKRVIINGFFTDITFPIRKRNYSHTIYCVEDHYPFRQHYGADMKVSNL